MRTFLEKQDGTSYYLINGSMGSCGDPKGHPNHTFKVMELRGGKECGYAAISYVAEDPRAEYFPPKVKLACKRLMEEWRAKVSA